MNNWEKLRLSIAIIAQLAGLFCLIVFFFFLWTLYSKDGGYTEYHLAGAIWVLLLYAFTAFLGSFMLAISIKKLISPVSFKVLSLPAFITGATILVWYFQFLLLGF